MAFNGIALGGFQQGWMDQSNLELNQQRAQQTYDLGMKGLQLQQQAQQNAQHRADTARIDKIRDEAMQGIISSIGALKQGGADDTKIYKTLGPWIDQLKKLTKTSGLDSSFIDAQVAGALARPATDISSITGGATQPTAAAPAAVPEAPSAASTMPNLTSPDTVSIGQPISAPVAQTPQAQADVDKFTLALARLPADANANVRQALTLRLQDALRAHAQNENIEVKTVKDENQNEHIVFVDKKNRTVTDQSGQPYVTPTGGDSDAGAIANAIQEGRQPPVLTGLYKNAKSVRAALARNDFDLSKAQLEWDAARKQIQSLNGPQMVRYAGLAKSVVNTIDEVKSLSRELQLSGVPLANAAQLQTYIQTQGNTPQGQLVTRYLAAVGTLKEEFANLANGGYAPTEPAWALANQQVNGNYGVKQLDASLTEIQRLIRYRLNGIPNFNSLGPPAANRYTPGQQDQGHAAPAGGDSGGGWSIQRIQ